MKGKIFLLLVAMLNSSALSSCTNNSATISALSKAGYTDIETTGWSPFVCGDDDTYETGFRAKNPSGDVVEGTVCCGVIAKGCTIRF